VLYVIPTLEERSDAVSRYKILTYLLLNWFGSVQDDGQQRSRYKEELHGLLDEPKLLYVCKKGMTVVGRSYTRNGWSESSKEATDVKVECRRKAVDQEVCKGTRFTRIRHWWSLEREGCFCRPGRWKGCNASDDDDRTGLFLWLWQLDLYTFAIQGHYLFI
jgi:hypothetical protein